MLCITTNIYYRQNLSIYQVQHMTQDFFLITNISFIYQEFFVAMSHQSNYAFVDPITKMSLHEQNYISCFIKHTLTHRRREVQMHILEK